MVRAADEALDAALARGQQPRAAVAADVVEGAQLTGAVAHDEQRPARHLGCQDVAGLAQLRDAADRDPARREDPLALEGEELVGAIRVGRQRLGQIDRPSRRRVCLLPGVVDHRVAPFRRCW